jgi:hypothetical protein
MEVSRVEFNFYIYDPHGSVVFSHTGNSMVGRRGYGGSELKNIPIAFYTLPGRYTLRAEVKVPDEEANFVSYKETDFVIYSPNIILTYPPNGARDILASHLVLRWVSSGATRYKVYVGDDTSFYKPLWTAETENTEITYPVEPENPLARLSAGKTYYWKVDGIDVDGKVIATTPLPFSFTIKDTATPSSRDLAVENVEFEEMQEDGVLVLRARVRNLGNQAFSMVSFDVSIAEMATKIPSQTIDTVQGNEARDIVFTCGRIAPALVEKAVSEAAVPGGIARWFSSSAATGKEGAGEFLPLTVTVALNIYDDNPKNNTLTRVVKVPLSVIKGKKGKVRGKVFVKGSKRSKAIKNAVVWFSGAANVYAITDDNGNYSVDNLPLGGYRVKVSHEEYIDSEEKAVTISMTKTIHTDVDFELEPKKKPPAAIAAAEEEGKIAAAVSTTAVPSAAVVAAEVEKKKEKEVRSYSMKEAWEIIKARLPDKNLVKELDTYILNSISCLPEEVDVNEIIDKISSGRVSIMDYSVEEEKEKQPTTITTAAIAQPLQLPEITEEEEGAVEVKKKEKKEKEKKPYALKEIWEKIKPHIADKEIVKELDTYTLYGVVLLPERDVEIGEVAEKISAGKIKIVSCGFEEEEKKEPEEAVMLPSVEEFEISLSEDALNKIWRRIKPYIPCEKQLLDDLEEGYTLQKIKLGSPKDDINKIVEDIEANRAKIKSYMITVE